MQPPLPQLLPTLRQAPLSGHSAPLKRVSRVEWLRFPLHLYTQRPRSFVAAGLGARLNYPAGGRCLAATSFGVTMSFELGAIPPLGEPLPAPGPTPRVSDTCLVNVNVTHESFRALRMVAEMDSPAGALASYQPFVGVLRAAVRGEASVGEVEEVVDAIVRHALRLAGCDGVRTDERVARAIHHSIDHRMCEVADLAKLVDLSTSRFSHLFTEHTGLSFREYTVYWRTALAWRLAVTQRERPLTEIAHEMGFADQAHMSRAFRQIFRMTPSSLRDSSAWIVHDSCD